MQQPRYIENKATPAEIKAQLHAPVWDTSRKRAREAFQYCLNFCDFPAFCKNHNRREASGGREAHRWFMLRCNWVLIKSVSRAPVIVCFQDSPCVSVCVIGCYRCCECVSGLKERLDRLQRCVCARAALKWHVAVLKRAVLMLSFTFTDTFEPKHVWVCVCV